jgi:hypothetical protein
MEASRSDVVDALRAIGFLDDDDAQTSFDPDKYSDEGWSGNTK